MRLTPPHPTQAPSQGPTHWYCLEKLADLVLHLWHLPSPPFWGGSGSGVELAMSGPVGYIPGQPWGARGHPSISTTEWSRGEPWENLRFPGLPRFPGDTPFRSLQLTSCHLPRLLLSTASPSAPATWGEGGCRPQPHL